MTCKLEDGQMDGWRDGSMEGQNIKMKGRERDGRTEGQKDDGYTDGCTGRRQQRGRAQIKLFFGFTACKVVDRFRI